MVEDMEIVIDSYETNIPTDQHAFELAIKKYNDECMDKFEDEAYSPRATLISKTYINYRMGERPYFEYRFLCSAG